MKRWHPTVTERNLVEFICLAQLLALWIYGFDHWRPETYIISSILLLWALRCWPKEKG